MQNIITKANEMNEEQLIRDHTKQLHAAPLGQFSILNANKNWTLCCLKMLDLIDINIINVKQQQLQMPLFRLYFFESLSILSAYVFFIPSCEVKLNPSYLRLVLPSAKHLNLFKNVKMTMQDNQITVFHSNDGACLISINGLKRVIKPLLVRRSEKNQFEEKDNQ